MILCPNGPLFWSLSLRFCIPPNLPRALGRAQFLVLSFFLSFFWQHFRDLYLRHAWTDFNQTWSQEPLTHGIYVIWPEWGQRSRRGHRGQKGQKFKNATPPTDYRVWSRDSCICISLTPSTKVMGLKNHTGSLGVTGVKRSFSLKMLQSSFILHSMTIRLIHVHQLEPLYLCYGVKCQSGVIWGHRGQKVIFTKNAIIRPCYTAWP